ncbi:hypothetical protein FACS189496_1570 [Bacilli bacterium]|nr:hypothetical protein FACS189496_1570 [Bacilli bacterium]
MTLTDAEIREAVKLIEAGKPLPDKYRFLLFDDKREDVPLQIHRLAEWCKDINNAQNKNHFDYIFVGESDFDMFKPDSFKSLAENFRKYKE